ncbi:PilZ domain-containing protein [Paraliomyxa miuraensis]|uniref:PilZ domain-containing protein n=1 Tax=Paraliomyxa miuraensis TaxID=376150 RepID=UPI0022520B12|nr:PilZ domain-containing protein [Paraliomyxa miuraensis]MCX4239809.1 PilZ domain-containing protein [Paraliomyxa miuraensis]
MSAESRLHPRFAVDARADVIGEEVVLSHPVADLSMGGCRFGEPAWESPGTLVQIVITFPTLAANLPLAGRVVRATEHDMGLRFENLTDEQKWALRKHLRDVQRDNVQRDKS